MIVAPLLFKNVNVGFATLIVRLLYVPAGTETLAARVESPSRRFSSSVSGLLFDINVAELPEDEVSEAPVIVASKESMVTPEDGVSLTASVTVALLPFDGPPPDVKWPEPLLHPAMMRLSAAGNRATSHRGRGLVTEAWNFRPSND